MPLQGGSEGAKQRVGVGWAERGRELKGAPGATPLLTRQSGAGCQVTHDTLYGFDVACRIPCYEAVSLQRTAVTAL